MRDDNGNIILTLPCEENKDITDPGKHYRYKYKGIKLDPFRIARIYNITNFAQLTILKKCLRLGTGGKTKEQDLKDIISACEREFELMKEDTEQYE